MVQRRKKTTRKKYTEVVHQELSSVYGALVDCRDRFKDVVEMFRSVQEIDKKIQEVSAYSLPESILGDEISSGAIVDPHLTDEGFLECLSVALKGSSPTKRMDKLVDAIGDVQGAMVGIMRKRQKLKSRINASSSMTPEKEIAIKKLEGVNYSINVLVARIEKLLGFYFETRKRVLSAVELSSAKVHDLFRQKRMDMLSVEFLDAMRKHDCIRIAENIAEFDKKAFSSSGAPKTRKERL